MMGRIPLVQRVGDKPAIADHLASLPEADQRHRFMTAATPELIDRYVAGLGVRGDVLLGAWDDRMLVAFAHVAVRGSSAEIGISLLPVVRRTGLADRLFAQGVKEASFLGAEQVTVSCDADNRPMIDLARRHGLVLQSQQYGEVNAARVLTSPAMPDRAQWTMTRMAEISGGIFCDWMVALARPLMTRSSMEC